MAHFLLILLFFLTILHLVTLKMCSVKLDHKTAPIFISGWTLIALAVLYPIHGHLLAEGWGKLAAKPWLLVLCAVKGGLLYLMFVLSQALMKVSLSSRHYVTPLSLGLISVVNFSLGEQLEPQQWFAVIGLFLLSAAFFFKGHLADLGGEGKRAYFQLVALAVAGAALDHVLTRDSNWYSLLLVSNVILFAVSVALNRRNVGVLRDAALARTALLAGVAYAAAEVTKFYQQVTINPVSVVITVQAMTKPVILILSAVIWKERTVREQMVWGAAAFVVTLPLFIDWPSR